MCASVRTQVYMRVCISHMCALNRCMQFTGVFACLTCKKKMFWVAAVHGMACAAACLERGPRGDVEARARECSGLNVRGALLRLLPRQPGAQARHHQTQQCKRTGCAKPPSAPPGDGCRRRRARRRRRAGLPPHSRPAAADGGPRGCPRSAHALIDLCGCPPAEYVSV